MIYPVLMVSRKGMEYAGGIKNTKIAVAESMSGVGWPELLKKQEKF